MTMYLTAGVLLLISGVYFGVFNRRIRGAGWCLRSLLGGGRGGQWSYGQGELSRRSSRSFQRQLPLRPDPGAGASCGQLRRIYLNDNVIQNTYDPERRQGASAFTYVLGGLARAYTTNISDVLCIGMGVGIVPREFVRQGARVDVVEINPAIVPMAARFFDLEPGEIAVDRRWPPLPQSLPQAVRRGGSRCVSGRFLAVAPDDARGFWLDAPPSAPVAERSSSTRSADWNRAGLTLRRRWRKH